MSIATCWQYRVKEKKKSDARVSEQHNFLDSVITVQRIRANVARPFIEEYEWLGNVGAAKYCYGLFIGTNLAAVVCYTAPCAARAFRRLLGPETATRTFQLCRGATAYWAPKWSASKLISASLRLLRRSERAMVVIAYADPAAGELGIVYQAANAYYLGLTDSRGPSKYFIGDRWYHARAVSKKFGCAADRYLKTIDPYYRRVQRTRKHRYAWVLERGKARQAILSHLLPLIKANPKRKTAIQRVA